MNKNKNSFQITGFETSSTKKKALMAEGKAGSSKGKSEPETHIPRWLGLVGWKRPWLQAPANGEQRGIKEHDRSGNLIFRKTGSPPHFNFQPQSGAKQKFAGMTAEGIQKKQ